MMAVLEVAVALLGAGLAASAAPTLLMARREAEGAATAAVIRLVIGGLVLMAAWKFFFAEQSVFFSTAQTGQDTPVANAGLSFFEHFVYVSRDGWYWVVGKIAAAIVSVLTSLCLLDPDSGGGEKMVLLFIAAGTGWAWYWI